MGTARESYTVKEVRHPRTNVLTLYRQAIDATIAVAALPYSHGRRHHREPLDTHEQIHHAKVDRFLRR